MNTAAIWEVRPWCEGEGKEQLRYCHTVVMLREFTDLLPPTPGLLGLDKMLKNWTKLDILKAFLRHFDGISRHFEGI